MASHASSVTPPVGADIESVCGKCGDVWHVVAAKVGDKIAKVQCKQCGAYHRHRPPGGTVAAATAPKAARAAKVKAPRAGRSGAQAAAAPAPPDYDPERPIRPYRPAEAYAVRERVQHPTFGLGVVTGSPGPGKMLVVFAGGERILAQAKAPPALERQGSGRARGPEPEDDRD